LRLPPIPPPLFLPFLLSFFPFAAARSLHLYHSPTIPIHLIPSRTLAGEGMAIEFWRSGDVVDLLEGGALVKGWLRWRATRPMDAVVKMEPWRGGFCGAASPIDERRRVAGEGGREAWPLERGLHEAVSIARRPLDLPAPGRRRHRSGGDARPFSAAETWRRLGFRRGNDGRHGRRGSVVAGGSGDLAVSDGQQCRCPEISSFLLPS
ncbi:unnamed protein product, partial [Urochloa humidicola]